MENLHELVCNDVKSHSPTTVKQVKRRLKLKARTVYTILNNSETIKEVPSWQFGLEGVKFFYHPDSFTPRNYSNYVKND